MEKNLLDHLIAQGFIYPHGQVSKNIYYYGAKIVSHFYNHVLIPSFCYVLRESLGKVPCLGCRLICAVNGYTSNAHTFVEV